MPRRRLIALAVLLCSTLFAGELAAWIFLRVQRSRHGGVFQMTPGEVIAALGSGLAGFLQGDKPVVPDARVGWTRKRPSVRHHAEFGDVTTDTDGNRVVPGATGPLLIDTYGDSFTECSEVADDATWQAHATRAMGARVRNFGVLGYGTDQAYLACTERLADGVNAPIVVLAMIEENLNRLMSAFRPFYTYPAIDNPLGFKPMLLEEGDGFRWVDFQPAAPITVASIEAAIVAAGRVDAFLPLRTERVRFPFLLHAAGYLLRRGLDSDRLQPGQTPRAKRRAAHLFAEFVRLATEKGVVPVLFAMPMEQAAFQTERLAQVQETVDLLPPEVRAKLIVIDGVALYRASGRAVQPWPERYSPYLRVTHPSDRGNRLLAELLIEGLLAAPQIRARPDLSEPLARAEWR